MTGFLKKGSGIRYANGNFIPFSYSDSIWADDFFDRKSTVGYLFILNGGPIAWASRKQSNVATCTWKAEEKEQLEAACEAVLIHG